MRVAIVAPSPVPYGPGGAEAVWSGLYRQLLEDSRHDVDLIKLPIRETTLPEVMAAYRTFADLDLTHFDVVVSGKYPAWMVRHPRHVVYLLHPLRGLYDSYGLFHRPLEETSSALPVRRLVGMARELTRESLPDLFAAWDTALGELGPHHPVMTFPGPLARTLVRAMDAMAMAPDQVVRHCAISWTVAGREGYLPQGVTPHVVHPPSDLAGLHEEPGEYFFTASRHDAPKRLDLLVSAMRYYPGERRLIIAGQGPQTEVLRSLAAGDPRIELVGRVGPAELVEHYARAVGVPFVPYDEDLGLITHEALSSGKPVLTTTDSGGPVEMVRDGYTGVVVPPTAEALGAGLVDLERLAADPEVAQRARATVRRQTWSHVVDVLLDDVVAVRPRVVRRRTARPRLVVASTFSVCPPRGGGQLRAFHLYGALTERFDVELVCQAPAGTAASVTDLRPGFVEHVVPRSAEHEAAEREISAAAGIPVTDIVAGRLSPLTPEYADVLAARMRGAVGVLLAHPFLGPVVHAVDPSLPTVYDAHNCEIVLKEQMLPAGPLTDELLDEVRAVEGAAVRDSVLVLAVSDEDRAAFRTRYGAASQRFVTAPNGTDLRLARFVEPDRRRRLSRAWRDRLVQWGGPELDALAIFIGSWHEPNNVAARHIVEMAADLPRVGFLLVGSHVGSLADVRLPRNVLPLGMVPDQMKATLLGAADVALAPLTSGSGTNLKVVEYLAVGVPVVSTPTALRGLRLEDNAAAVCEPEEMADAVRAILAEPPSAEALARVTVQVRRTYDWEVIGHEVAPRLAHALGVGGQQHG